MKVIIKDNYSKIKSEIPNNVTIVAAAKTRSKDEILDLIDAGGTNIGHNYLQEAESMFQQLGEKANKIRWHMIGHLQSNKINKALKIFDVIQTVDSLKKANEINKRVEASGKSQISILIEINIGSEITKAGLPPDQEIIEELIIEISRLKHLKVEGLMTMGPVTGNPEDVRPYFKKTKIIFDNIKSQNIENVDMKTLSMGMSNSYKVAIEEGSNMIRLGTILFGPRK